MDSFDPVLETRIIKTLCDRPKANLYAKLGADYFGTPSVKEAWERLSTLKKNGKAFPTSTSLANDSILSEASRVLVGGPLTAFEEHEIDFAMDSLEKLRKGRYLLYAGQKIAEICKDSNPDLGEAMRLLETCLRRLQITNAEDNMLSYGGENEKTLEMYDEMMAEDVEDVYIRTGFKVIDDQQGGFGRGRVYTLGANSGGGKSTLANCLSINMYLGGYSGGYCSMEMAPVENMVRTQSVITRIPNKKFQLKTLTSEERAFSDMKLAEFLAYGEANGKRLDYICPTGGVNISQFFAQVEHLNYDFYVIDYINLMDPLDPKKALWENIGEAFRLAKIFARKTNSVVIMLVQTDEDTKNLKYARAIKHHSDGVWVWEVTDKERELGFVEVEQPKFRNAKPLKFPLKIEFEYCSFSEASGDGAKPAAAKTPEMFKPMKLS